jgi:hypothetical protein
MKSIATLTFAGMLLAGAAVSAAPVTLEGTLVDSVCYLQHGATGNDHGGMKDCGTMCLKSGTPGAVLTSDKKLHVIIAPSTALADYVGMPIRVTGEENGTAILASTAQVKKDGKWVDVKLGSSM